MLAKSPSHASHRFYHLRLGLLGAVLLTNVTLSQTNTPKPADDAVELSPFVVQAAGDSGYVATNTLAGSRLNTSLKDVASPLEVFTKDFLDDIGATSVTDALLYHSNAQMDLGDENAGMQQDYKAQAQVSNRFTVRGQQQTLARDFFNFNLPQDLFSTERVDASRGPNSILFGIGNAGGVTNTTSKTANFWKDATSLGVQAGSCGYIRYTLDHNQVVNQSFALRLNLLQQDGRDWQVYSRDERFGAQLASTWRLGKNTRLRTDAEYGTKGDYASRTYPVITAADKWNLAGRPTYDSSVVRTTAQINALPSSLYTANNAVTGAPVSARLLTAATNDAADRFVWVENGGGQFFSSSNRYTLANLGQRQLDQDEIYGTMINGPGAERDLDYKSFSAFLEHQFSRSFQVELAANWWTHDWSTISFGNEGLPRFPCIDFVGWHSQNDSQPVDSRVAISKVERFGVNAPTLAIYLRRGRNVTCTSVESVGIMGNSDAYGCLRLCHSFREKSLLLANGIALHEMIHPKCDGRARRDLNGSEEMMLLA